MLLAIASARAAVGAAQESSQQESAVVQESRDRGRRSEGMQGGRSERLPSERSRGNGGEALPAERNAGMSPFSLMSQLTQEMDRMFEGFWNRPFGLGRGRRNDGERALSERRWAPELEMHEHDGQFLVRLDLPGMKREDVDVEVVGQTLTIQGERRQECQSEENGWHHTECRYGSFFRSIPLPDGVDPEQIQAQFHNGVLEIRMPAPDRSERRNRIEVREGSSAGRGDGAKDRKGGTGGRPEAT
jgi:HSP20 family protein